MGPDKCCHLKPTKTADINIKGGTKVHILLNLSNIKRLAYYVGPTEGIKHTDKNNTLEYYSVGSRNSEVGYMGSFDIVESFRPLVT